MIGEDPKLSRAFGEALKRGLGGTHVGSWAGSLADAAGKVESSKLQAIGAEEVVKHAAIAVARSADSEPARTVGADLEEMRKLLDEAIDD